MHWQDCSLFWTSGNKSSSKLIQVVGSFQFRVVVGLPLFARSHSQLLEASYILWLVAPYLHLRSLNYTENSSYLSFYPISDPSFPSTTCVWLFCSPFPLSGVRVIILGPPAWPSTHSLFQNQLISNVNSICKVPPPSAWVSVWVTWDGRLGEPPPRLRPPHPVRYTSKSAAQSMSTQHTAHS